MAYTEVALDTTTNQIEADTVDFPPELGSTKEVKSETISNTEEKMLLSKSSGKLIAKWLDLPEIHAEIDRAVWQVERSIRVRQQSQSTSRNDDPGTKR